MRARATQLGCCGRPMISKGLLGEAKDCGPTQHRGAAALRRPRRADRRHRAVLPAHLPRRVPGPPRRATRAGSRRNAWLLDELVARLLTEEPSLARAVRRQRPRDADVLLHAPLPPEGHRRPRRRRRRACALRGAGYEVSADRLRLLRHGGLVRLRGRALRHVARDGRAAPLPRRRGGAPDARRHHGRQLPAADRPLHVRAPAPLRRAARGRPQGLTDPPRQASEGARGNRLGESHLDARLARGR